MTPPLSETETRAAYFDKQARRRTRSEGEEKVTAQVRKDASDPEMDLRIGSQAIQ